MSDERPRKELIELPLSHGKTWDTVDKGDEGGELRGEPERRRRERRPPSRDSRRGLVWLLAVAVLAGLAYWLFWPSAPRIEFSVVPLEFEQRLAGSTSEPRVVVLTNAGERALRIEGVGIVEAERADFATDSEDCSGMELPTGAECRVGVRFAPRAPGARTGELEIVGNMRGGSTLLPLAGEAIAPRLAARPEVLDFGTESVGGTSPGLDLELVNAGSAPLTLTSLSVGSSGSEFRLIGNQCSSSRLEPDESCGVRLVFEPELLGVRTAELEVVSDSFGEAVPITLRGTGSGPDLRVEPQGLTFEAQLVGTRSDVSRLTLTNHGNEVFRINRVWLADTGSFSLVGENCSGASVEPSSSCRVEVAFEPDAEGEARTSLQIRESSGAMAPGVGISGRGVAPRLELSSGSLDFGAVPRGERTAERSVGLSNAGTATLSIQGTRVVGDDTAAFPKGRDGCSGIELAPGERCEVRIAFDPGRGGGHRARLAISSNQRGEAPSVGLSGHARAPELSLERERLDFAAVRQSESQDLELEVGNSGDAPLEVRAVRAGGAAAPDFTVAVDSCSRRSLEPGGSCSVLVRFTPTANGPRDARLVLESDATSAPASLILRGVGLPPPDPGVEVTPLEVDFGGRTVGDRSEVATVTVASVGEGRLRITDVRLTGRDPGDFRIVPGTCEGLPHVVPGGDCTIGVRFRATAAGPRSAVLVIEHNAERSAIEVRLAGEGY